jgi:hypothetical protein
VEFPPGTFESAEDEDEARKRIMDRFAQIGHVLMTRGRSQSDIASDPIGSILNDPLKRRTAAEILGQAYFTAYVFVAHNRARVEHIADVLVERRELYGDEVVSLLDDARLERVDLPYLEEAAWPRL